MHTHEIVSQISVSLIVKIDNLILLYYVFINTTGDRKKSCHKLSTTLLTVNSPPHTNWVSYNLTLFSKLFSLKTVSDPIGKGVSGQDFLTPLLRYQSQSQVTVHRR